MGLFDKMRGAVQAVTGGAARVTIAYQPAVPCAGDTVIVSVTVTSTGGEVSAKGLFVDLAASEAVRIRANTVPNLAQDVNAQHDTANHAFQIAPAFVLAANETKVFEGALQLPAGMQPSYTGHFTTHTWRIRARVDAFGNDPDSGFAPIGLGLRG